MAPVVGYWDIRGFTSPIRNLLYYKEVEFEDKVYTIGPAPEYNISGWTAVKPTLGLDFPNLPYYIDGDVKLSQSLTILRYLGRKYNLVGETEAETLRVELAEQQAVDFRYNLMQMLYFNPNYEKDREAYLKKLPDLIEPIAKFLGTNSWVAGDKITYADFILYDALDFNRLFSPETFQSAGAAIVNNFLDRFENIPQIKAYMTSGKYKKLPIVAPVAAWGGQTARDHFETMKAYKEMDRQDREAARTGTKPEYVRTGVVNMGSSGSSNGSNAQSNDSNSKSSNRSN